MFHVVPITQNPQQWRPINCFCAHHNILINWQLKKQILGNNVYLVSAPTSSVEIIGHLSQEKLSDQIDLDLKESRAVKYWKAKAVMVLPKYQPFYLLGS